MAVRLSAFNPWKVPGTHFCYRLSQPQCHSAAGRIGLIETIHHRDSNQRPSGLWHRASTNYATACPICPLKRAKCFWYYAVGLRLCSRLLIRYVQPNPLQLLGSIASREIHPLLDIGSIEYWGFWNKNWTRSHLLHTLYIPRLYPAPNN
jgi:hypothetical protein